MATLTRDVALARLRNADADGRAFNALAAITEAQLDGALRARALGHAPRGEGAERERIAAALVAFDLANTFGG